MVGPYFHGPILDDVMRSVIEKILSHGDRIRPTKGPATELIGVLLEIVLCHKGLVLTHFW